MRSMLYNYWVVQCEKGFKLEEDDDNYECLSDETVYIEYDLYVYKVQGVIYAIHYKDLDYDHYIIN